MAFTFCGVELANPFFLAPMAGLTDRSFRAIALESGAGLAFTEMISAAGLTRGDRTSRSLLPSPAEAPRVGVQLFGGRPDDFRAATLKVNELAVPFIDVNFGCPARKVVRSGCGVALMREPARVRAILEAVCAVANKPVLAKIRAGWDDAERNAVQIARIARACGVAAVTVHGRTGRQGFTGAADWGAVREVVADGVLPVTGNGDLVTAAQAVRALAETGCAAVMIGRGACGNPWIFREAASLLAGDAIPPPTDAEVAGTMARHLALAIEEHGTRRGVQRMRRHLIWYARGRAGAHEFRRRVVRLAEPAAVLREIEAFFVGG
ncbi:MAG TPA: tRNA dihydrouridine synthase DusB [Candidatus Methanoperedens sp.]|nr:tRNA dihydrouridine synthase DusB [Candidatus Methanoperedens sp.]